MSFDKQYIRADKFIIFNDNDPNLVPIKYELPKPPPFKDTLGYGLDPLDQYWEHLRPKPSYRLLNLMAEKISDYEKVKRIDDHPREYEKEAEFIEQEWEYRLNGMWIFIKGKQVWLTGKFYFFLQYWIDKNRKRPEFRKRDLEKWLFKHMVINDPVCFGYNYPKFRREGSTTTEKCDQVEEATRTPNFFAGCQSKDETHAAFVHEMMVFEPFKQLPFYFKPIWDEDYKKTANIKLFAPTGQKNPNFDAMALNSYIDFQPSGIKAYDGTPLNHLHNDEIGKTEECDVERRWSTQKLCLLQGGILIGKAYNTSTVDEMEFKGGQAFKNICDKSHYTKPPGSDRKITPRNANGQTVSGLYNFFIPAYEGLSLKDPKTGRTSIDKYGDTDTEWTKAYIQNMLDSLEASGDYVQLVETMRIYPREWSDCWRVSAKDCHFNAYILSQRIKELEEHPLTRKGNFEWVNGQRFGLVDWVDEDLSRNIIGRFNTSWLFDDFKLANRFHQSGPYKLPVNTNKFCVGADTYKMISLKGSKGGLSGYLKYDHNIDRDKDMANYETDRFMFDYSFRHNDWTLFAEDALKACLYFSCKLSAEVNIENLVNFFRENGYGGYLHHRRTKKGLIDITPGDTTDTKLVESIFLSYEKYITYTGLRCKHLEILKQCRDIQDDMKPFDLFVAGGYCLIEKEDTKFDPIVAVTNNTVESYFQLHDVD